MARWTPDDRIKVRLMLLGHEPFSAIAARFRMTRSAVAGRIFRDPELKQAVLNDAGGKRRPRVPKTEGLVTKAMPTPPKIEQRTVKPAPVPKPKPEPEQQETAFMAEEIEERKGVPLADILSGQCRWPLWENTSLTFPMCGAPVKSDAVYCKAHAARAFTGSRRALPENQPRSPARLLR